MYRLPPGGNLISADVQAALLELDADKLALAGGTMTGDINMGTNDITNGGTITGTTITGTTLTDGTLSINTGAITGALSIGTGTLTATGAVTGGTLTDGTASITSGAVTGVTTLSASGAATVGSVVTAGTVDGRDVSVDGGNQDNLQTLTGVGAGSTNPGTFTGSIISDSRTVKEALQDLETDLGAQTDDQTAAEVSFTPGGNLISTDVQAALLELDADKLALAGGTMTGDINAGTNDITNGGTITGTTNNRNNSYRWDLIYQYRSNNRRSLHWNRNPDSNRSSHRRNPYRRDSFHHFRRSHRSNYTECIRAATVGSVVTAGTVDGRDVSVDGGNQDNLQTLTGVGAGSTNLGTFTGSIISDSRTVKEALQDLETDLGAQTDDQTAAEVSFTLVAI
ncbi:MAG: hypothetical protein IPN68_00045 [Bacteroidetes bacterium]|nr:hypothetical protein [Bacteroidota bacterium]